MCRLSFPQNPTDLLAAIGENVIRIIVGPQKLFFEAGDGKMMAVAVKAVTPREQRTKPSFEAGAPVPLFDAHMVHQGTNVAFEYDVTADGKRFLINTIAGSGGGPGVASAPPLTVVTNWQAGVKK